MKEIKGFYGQYRWLSNFAPGKCIYNDIEFPRRENAFQYGKGFLGGEDQNSPLMMAFHSDTSEHKVYTPKEAKAKGYKVKKHIDWDYLRLNVMELVVNSAFNLNPELARLLINTGDAYLEESLAWHDIYWGVCYGELYGKRCKQYPHEPVGENNLGKILMNKRTQLISLKGKL